MKYFIGHLIEGKFGTWHAAVTNDIAEKFNTWKIQDVCPSHITLFSEFEIDNIEAVENVIETVITNAHTGKYSVSEFGRFEERAVFVKVDANKEVVSLVQKLRKNLEEIPSIPKDKHLIWGPHATVAFRLSPDEIAKIWNYVVTLEKPSFITLFNNITLFRLDTTKWVVEKTFQIQNSK